jgi:hypothetical protein
VARPTKLTPETLNLYVEARRLGCSITGAAIRAHFSGDTAMEWLKRGEKATSGLHRDFYLADRAALAHFELTQLAIIQKAAAPRRVVKRRHGTGPKGPFDETTDEATEIDWKASAWLLERRMPEEYARLQKLEHTGKDGGPLMIREVVVEMPPVDDDASDSYSDRAEEAGASDPLAG